MIWRRVGRVKRVVSWASEGSAREGRVDAPRSEKRYWSCWLGQIAEAPSKGAVPLLRH